MIIVGAGMPLLLLAAPGPVLTLEHGADYPETTAVLTEIYHDELRAYSTYKVYAGKAEEEGYPKIAALFRAITVSEMIHARNMKHLLEGLGVEVVDVETSVEVSTTKRNLKRAMNVELSEISESYPLYLERITPENYQPAIDAVGYSWNSEKQHRENITKIRDASGFFFGLLAKKIESAPAAYYVCTACGSTVREPPESTCSICGAPASRSVKVPGDEPPPE
jgi:rubrerythrin